MDERRRDDTRLNGKIPDVGSKLKVDGLDFMVTVHKVEETQNLDGNGQPVCNIFIKAPNRSLQSMLPSLYLNSQTARYDIQEENEVSIEESPDTEWEDCKDSNAINTKVRKYIPRIGWCNGVITNTKIHKTQRPYVIRYHVSYEEEEADDEVLNGDEYMTAAAYASMESPPTAPPLVLAALNANKDADRDCDREIRPSVSSSQEDPLQVRNRHVTSAVVPYEGLGGNSTIGELVAQANNMGLHFVNSYSGLESISVMACERHITRRLKTITWRNEGAWAHVYTGKSRDDSVLQPNYNFPKNAICPTRLPVIWSLLAEVHFNKTSYKLDPDCTLSRGSIYRALNRLGHGEDDVFYYLHAILQEDSHNHRLFCCDMIVVSVICKGFDDLCNGMILILNKSSIRDKKPVPESELQSNLEVDESRIRSVLQTSESNFVVWYNDGSPTLENMNTHRVTRQTDALGADWFPDIVSDDSADTTKNETDKRERKKRNNKRTSVNNNLELYSKKQNVTVEGKGRKNSSDRTRNILLLTPKGKCNSRSSTETCNESDFMSSSSVCASRNVQRKMISPNTHEAAVAGARNAVMVEMQNRLIEAQERSKNDVLLLSQTARAEQNRLYQTSLLTAQQASNEAYRQIGLQNSYNAYQRFENPSDNHAKMFAGLMGMQSTIKNPVETNAQQSSYSTSRSAELRSSFPTSSITLPEDKQHRITYGKYYDVGVIFQFIFY